MRGTYIMIISLFALNTFLLSQGVDFPDPPAQQVPINGLALLTAGGAALAYKKFKNK